MPEIGSTLREARMRARIDISQLEVETKIRAKYLRALENEEWESLPGPTYIKSFLKTYADALGLDGKLLVQEYKARHERLSESELQPITPLGARRPQRERRRGAGRDITVAVVVVAIIGALIAVGRSGGGSKTTPAPAAGPTHRHKPKRHHATAAPAPRRAKLTLTPLASVYVCLEAAHKRIVIHGATLQPGRDYGPYRSKRFTMTFGNYLIRMRVNGKLLTVPPSSGPVAYEVTPGGRHQLPSGTGPTCQ